MKTLVPLAFAAVIVACPSQPPQSPPGNEYEIVGTDHAFQIPSSMPASRVTLRFTNKGKVRHELNVSRLKPGVSIERFLQARRAGEAVQPLIEGPVGVLFAPPGGRSTDGLSVDMRPGQRYAVICIFRDSANAQRHYDLGMYSVITVGRAAAIAGTPQPVTDTIVATDYAFQYPRTVAPGRHSFVLRNEGKVRHELTFALLKPGVTFERVQEVAKAGGDDAALFEGSFGLLHAPGGQTPLGQLTIDMLPDREYAIACFLKDDAKAPEHVEMGMFGSIRTSAQPSG